MDRSKGAVPVGWKKGYVVASLVVTGLTVAGGISVVRAKAGSTLSDKDAKQVIANVKNDPFCQSFKGMSDDKAKMQKEECDKQLQLAYQAIEVGLLPKDPKTVPPAPTVASEEPQNVQVGLISKWSRPSWAKPYIIQNQWLGEIVIVYAGADGADSEQGLVLIGDRTKADVPQLGRYKTSTKVGALRIVRQEGNSLFLTSDSGVEFKFDISARALVQL